MTDKEKTALALRAAKLFPKLFPENRKHDVHPGKEKYECDKCDKTWPFKGNDPCVLSERKCTVPDPVDVEDRNVAMRLFREVDGYWAQKALSAIWLESDFDCGFGWWQAHHATPADYILAACKARERE